MEEERIGSMYFRLLLGGMGRQWRRMFPRGVLRSPWVVILIVAVLVIGPGIAWRLHAKSRLRRLRGDLQNINSAAEYENNSRPGGLAPIVLSRTPAAESDEPEFVSATFLPGLGMGVLQIGANLPGRGRVALMDSPSVQALANGTASAPSGVNDDDGAIEVPWGGAFMGITAPSGTGVMSNWRGATIEESTDGSAQSIAAEGGNLREQAADETTPAKPNGGTAVEAVFHNLNSDGRWPSKTDVTIQAHLSGKAIDLLVVAKNTGDHAEPLGIGWHPRFSVGSHRDSVQLKLPKGQTMAFDAVKGVPTGHLEPAGAGVSRFQRDPAALGSDAFDETLVDAPGAADGTGGGTGSGIGPAVEMIDPSAGYGLRMTSLSPAIRAIRVVAPGAADYVSLGMQTNMDDPLGKEWEDKGIAVVEPGQSVEFHVRLEIFAVPRQ